MTKNLKYKLTEKFILVGDKKLFRIKALKDFGDVKSGDLGGFIEKESNLSQEGNCWVYGNTRVYGNAKVYDCARVYGNAWIYGNAWVARDAQVFGNAQVYDNSWVYDNAQIYGDAWVYGNAHVYGDAKVYGNAQVSGNSWIYGGVWPISPFYFCLSKHSITSCDYTHLKIGCLVHTIEEWRERGEEIGKKYGYSDKDIEFYCESLLFAEKYIELVKSSINND